MPNVTCDIPVLSANELRALAEQADSIRDKKACVVKNPNHGDGGPKLLAMSMEDAATQKLDPLFEMMTKDHPEHVERDKIVLTADKPLELDAHKKLNINDCDAIFTSLSAVEKFVVPYYVRLRGMVDFEKVREKFAKDASAVAMLHLPSSDPDTARQRVQLLVAAAKRGAETPRIEVLSLTQYLAR